MTALIPFEADFIPQSMALWRALHPDWTWLDDPEVAPKAFEFDEYRSGFAVRHNDTLIGTIFGSRGRDPDWPCNRYIQIEAAPENLTADWMAPGLAGFADLDRDHADLWHIVSPAMEQWSTLGPLLEASGFTLYCSTMNMEWVGEKVTLTDPGPVRLERYTGGNPEFDKAIVDLHNRSYRRMRLTPPADIEYMWKPWPGLTAHEYVLAWEGERMVGYAEWMVTNDKPLMNSLVAARSHWGTPVAAAAGTKAMEYMLALGYRTLYSSVFSRNAASIKLQQRHGWVLTTELARCYVRKFGATAA